MGFDLIGRDPEGKKGEYFRNNVWWWHPLAEYILENVKLHPNETKWWHSNDSQNVSARSAKKIAAMLREHAAEGKLKEIEKKHFKKCEVCKGMWKKCEACNGNGKVLKKNISYPFSEANALEFADFAEKSGGFTIC